MGGRGSGGAGAARGGGGGAAVRPGSTISKQGSEGKDWSQAEIDRVNTLADASKGVGLSWSNDGFTAKITMDGEQVGSIKPQYVSSKNGSVLGAYVTARGLNVEGSYTSMSRAVSALDRAIDKTIARKNRR